VVLQSLGQQQLPPDLHHKTRTILQSTTTLPPFTKSSRQLRCIAVGHLRSEKSPDTLMHAAAQLDDLQGLRIDHLGAGLDDALVQLARETAARHPHYRWLGALPHHATRQRIRKAHVLIHPSRMEGGAHVVMEAVCSSTPVLASRIDGNIGMLGEDYEGYFPLGDADALARLIRQLRSDVPLASENTLYSRLVRQCAARAPLFAPTHEQAALLALVAALTPDKLAP
jgi:glycosyltransferase involved in cell wall biosynthesis